MAFNWAADTIRCNARPVDIASAPTALSGFTLPRPRSVKISATAAAVSVPGGLARWATQSRTSARIWRSAESLHDRLNFRRRVESWQVPVRNLTTVQTVSHWRNLSAVVVVIVSSGIIEQTRSGVLYNFGRFCLYVLSVCLSVCLSDDNLRKPSRRKFVFANPVYLHGILVKFVYEGHRVKVKVGGAKRPQMHIAAM